MVFFNADISSSTVYIIPRQNGSDGWQFSFHEAEKILFSSLDHSTNQLFCDVITALSSLDSDINGFAENAIDLCKVALFWWLESGQTVEVVNEEDSWKNFKLFSQFVFEKLRARKLMHFFNCEHNIIQVFCSKPFIQSSVRHRIVRGICIFLGLHVFLPRRVRTQCSNESSRQQMVRTKS